MYHHLHKHSLFQGNTADDLPMIQKTGSSNASERGRFLAAVIAKVLRMYFDYPLPVCMSSDKPMEWTRPAHGEHIWTGRYLRDKIKFKHMTI